MKKLIVINLIIIGIFVIVSCNNKTTEKEKEENTKKASNLTELKTKYSNKKFKDCDEFLEAGTEMIDVYIETINKAYEGDEDAKVDLDRFDTFMNQYDKMAEEFAKECPEKFDIWADASDAKVNEISDKLFEIYKSDIEYDIQYDDELEKELEKELEELNRELDKILAEENENQ